MRRIQQQQEKKKEQEQEMYICKKNGRVNNVICHMDKNI